ncbi:MAG: hypothetical protein QOE58_3485 [Actinomycetota bacterium]|nr:hypothetical protein [Actinomycetota bacterium]
MYRSGPLMLHQLEGPQFDMRRSNAHASSCSSTPSPLGGTAPVTATRSAPSRIAPKGPQPPTEEINGQVDTFQIRPGGGGSTSSANPEESPSVKNTLRIVALELDLIQA